MEIFRRCSEGIVSVVAEEIEDEVVRFTGLTVEQRNFRSSKKYSNNGLTGKDHNSN